MKDDPAVCHSLSFTRSDAPEKLRSLTHKYIQQYTTWLRRGGSRDASSVFWLDSSDEGSGCSVRFLQ
jgi:hypothetical protein